MIDFIIFFIVFICLFLAFKVDTQNIKKAKLLKSKEELAESLNILRSSLKELIEYDHFEQCKTIFELLDIAFQDNIEKLLNRVIKLEQEIEKASLYLTQVGHPNTLYKLGIIKIEDFELKYSYYEQTRQKLYLNEEDFKVSKQALLKEIDIYFSLQNYFNYQLSFEAESGEFIIHLND